MTNTMTPSEIADWHKTEADWAAAASDYEAAEMHLKIEAAIRKQAEALEIAEGDRDVARNDCDMLVERVKRYEYELKIATEALEAIEVTYPEGSGARVEASCALARIKEG